MSYNRPEYVEEDSTFVRKVESDSNVCNNCYRKIREHTETVHKNASSVTEYEENVEFDYFDDFCETGRPNIEKAYCECGAVDWNEFRIRPMDMERMKRAGSRIINRLEEKEYSVESLSFYKVIEENGNLPEYQFKEEQVFEMAVEKAVKESE